MIEMEKLKDPTNVTSQTLEKNLIFHVHAVENEELMLKAYQRSEYIGRSPRYPHGYNGKIEPKIMELRKDAIVRNTLKHGPVSILWLGGSYDLRENIKRIDRGAELIVVKTQGYLEVDR